MTAQKMSFLIKDDGTIQSFAEGFTGEACIVESDKLIAKMKALGLDITITHEEKTKEAYVTEKTSDRIQTRS